MNPWQNPDVNQDELKLTSCANTNEGASLSALFAFQSGKKYLEGTTQIIELRIDHDLTPGMNNSIPYRYQSTDATSSAFLSNADPCTTGLANTATVDMILEQIQRDGFQVDRTNDEVRIIPPI